MISCKLCSQSQFYTHTVLHYSVHTAYVHELLKGLLVNMFTPNYQRHTVILLRWQ